MAAQESIEYAVRYFSQFMIKIIDILALETIVLHIFSQSYSVLQSNHYFPLDSSGRFSNSSILFTIQYAC